MAAPLYQPPTRVTTSQLPYLGLVAQADNAWARDKYWDVEYTFSGHVYEANPYVRGLYNRLSNTYPVGAAYGQPDPLVIDNLAPTVGNEVPGLYQAVPDGKGWA
jgi:hypothetical protein